MQVPFLSSVRACFSGPLKSSSIAAPDKPILFSLDISSAHSYNTSMQRTFPQRIPLRTALLQLEALGRLRQADAKAGCAAVHAAGGHAGASQRRRRHRQPAGDLAQHGGNELVPAVVLPELALGPQRVAGFRSAKGTDPLSLAPIAMNRHCDVLARRASDESPRGAGVRSRSMTSAV